MKNLPYSHRKFITLVLVLLSLTVPSRYTSRVAQSLENQPVYPFGVARWFDFHDEAAAMGAHWGRLRVFWKHVEPEDDLWHFESVDDVLDSLDARGIQGVLLLRTGELDWATEQNAYGETYDNSSFLPLDLSPQWDEKYGYSKSYYDMVYNLTVHLCHRVKVMVIENEGNSLKFFYGSWSDYLKLIKTAYKAAHDACPDVVVTNSGLASGLFGWCIVDDMIASGEYTDEEICDFATGYYRRSSLNGSYIFSGPGGMDKILYRLEQEERGITFADSLITNMCGAVDAYNLHFYEDYGYLEDVIAWVDRKMAEGGYAVPVKISNELGIRNRNEQYDRESMEHAQDVIRKLVQSVRCGLRILCWFPMSDGFNSGDRWKLTSDKIGLGDGYPKNEGGCFIPRYAYYAYQYLTTEFHGGAVFEGEDTSVEHVIHWEFAVKGNDSEKKMIALWWDDGYGSTGSEEITLEFPPDVDDVTVKKFPDYEVHVDPGDLGGRYTLTVDNDPTLVSYGMAVTGTGGGEDTGPLPRIVMLEQNYPNPFNPSTTIRFSVTGLPGSPVLTELAVFTGRGAKIRTLMDGNLPPGSYSVVWNGRDDRGNQVPSGVYMCRLQAGGEISTKKLLLVR